MENKTLAQLREEAKTLGITNVTKYKKDELASLIEEAKPKEEPQKQRTETVEVTGILQVCEDGFGFLRGENYLSCPDDVYVAPAQIRRFRLKTGDMITGIARLQREGEKFRALLYVNTVNGDKPDSAIKRTPFENLVPVYPDKRLHLEYDSKNFAMRLIDVIAPIGKGQRGIIVSPPKAGKTTLLKQIAKSIERNHPETELIVLLIDER
ncbi:MAG: Rho termination factor N-terminal domain-containing protein, partial [Clostridia bacterium]|nr:Rho termination factor N-terminal domain-containing protein [Clostridia bacterium]